MAQTDNVSEILTQAGVFTLFPPVSSQSSSVSHRVAQVDGHRGQVTTQSMLQSQVALVMHALSSEGHSGAGVSLPPDPDPPEPAPPEPSSAAFQTQPAMTSQLASVVAAQPIGVPAHDEAQPHPERDRHDAAERSTAQATSPEQLPLSTQPGIAAHCVPLRLEQGCGVPLQ